MTTSPFSRRLSSVRAILLSVVALGVTAACHNRAPAAARPAVEDSVSAGNGVQPQKQTGRAVRSIGGEELARRKVKRVEELLAGRVPGVRVLPTPDGGFAIRIRGGNNEPLYIVDGVSVEVTAGQGLNWLDPADIERIDVLKDPVELTMYGGRGANGVILIKTKGR